MSPRSLRLSIPPLRLSPLSPMLSPVELWGLSYLVPLRLTPKLALLLLCGWQRNAEQQVQQLRPKPRVVRKGPDR
eukprot:3507648-Rhodomonas_salina.3